MRKNIIIEVRHGQNMKAVQIRKEAKKISECFDMDILTLHSSKDELTYLLELRDKQIGINFKKKLDLETTE